ncbi:MAG TPA: DUF6141 family protein [Bacteroidales bacterium]|nr:DUF6141 family protein [Bacteroidales bacterium]
MSQLFFRETQRFNQPWIWVMNLGMVALFVFLIFTQLFAHRPVGNHPAPDFLLLLLLLFPIGMIVLFRFIRLETEIRRDGIYFRFPPFIRKERTYHWEDIRQCHVRKYSPIGEYGGWGYRVAGKRSGVAYNISGNMGIQIELKNGKKILLGTRKPEEAKEALRKSGI